MSGPGLFALSSCPVGPSFGHGQLVGASVDQKALEVARSNQHLVVKHRRRLGRMKSGLIPRLDGKAQQVVEGALIVR